MTAPNTNFVLAPPTNGGQPFADKTSSGSIDLGHNTSNEGVIYQMAEKSISQTYYDEVEALKANGSSNAEAINQVAEKHGKKVNAVRAGIYQYTRKHLNGDGATGTTRRRRSSQPSVDDFLANARSAVESALALVDREVDEAKAELDAAQRRYDEVQANVKERKADIEKRLKALA